MIYSKTRNVEWAKANGARFVFMQYDGMGKKTYFVTNDDRRAEPQLNLVWEA